MVRVKNVTSGRDICVGGVNGADVAVAYAFCKERGRLRWFLDMLDSGRASLALRALPMTKRKGAWKCGAWVAA